MYKLQFGEILCVCAFFLCVCVLFKHKRVDELPRNVVWREKEKKTPYYVFKKMIESSCLVFMP